MNKKQISNLPITTLLLAILFACGCATTKSSNGTGEFELSGPVISCGHLNVYQLSEDNKSYIQFIINTKKIDLLKDNSWNLAEENNAIVVRYRSFDDTVSSGLCNDIMGKRIKPVKEEVVDEGILNLRLSDEEWQNYKTGRRYKVDLRASGLKLNDEKKYSVKIDQAVVGWLPG